MSHTLRVMLLSTFLQLKLHPIQELLTIVQENFRSCQSLVVPKRRKLKSVRCCRWHMRVTWVSTKRRVILLYCFAAIALPSKCDSTTHSDSLTYYVGEFEARNLPPEWSQLFGKLNQRLQDLGAGGLKKGEAKYLFDQFSRSLSSEPPPPLPPTPKGISRSFLWIFSCSSFEV